MHNDKHKDDRMFYRYVCSFDAYKKCHLKITGEIIL